MSIPLQEIDCHFYYEQFRQVFSKVQKDTKLQLDLFFINKKMLKIVND